MGWAGAGRRWRARGVPHRLAIADRVKGNRLVRPIQRRRLVKRITGGAQTKVGLDFFFEESVPMSVTHGRKGRCCRVSPAMEATMTQLSGIRKSGHLTDAQFLVLSEAAGRDSGFVVIPERLKGKAAQSFVRTLIGKELVREVQAKADMPVWRRDGERGKAYALKITAVGRKTIPIETTHQNSPAITTEKSGGITKSDSPKEPSDDASPRVRITKSRVRPPEKRGRTGKTPQRMSTGR